MVDVSLSSIVPKVSSTQIISSVLWFCVIIVVVGFIGYLIWYYLRKKRYNQLKVVIWEKDSNGNVHEFYDRAGIFIDKQTGFKLFFLEKVKKGLNPNRVPFVSSKDKKGRLIKTVYLRKIGVSNYVYCDMLLDKQVEFHVGEEDVNWAAQDIERIKRTFNKENWLQKFAPYIMFIVTILIVMIVLISLFNKFGVIKDASDNMLRVTEAQLKITQSLQEMTNQTIQDKASIPIIRPAGGG
jgi:hypothetical protein